MGKRIEMLWSGGWDSTFMLCKLLREYDEVQPYYIRFHRSGEEMEMKAINEITDLLEEHKNLKGRLLPVTYVEHTSIKFPGWLVEAWKKYRDEPYTVSKQYLFLAAFAIKHKGIAVGQERYYEKPGHITRLMYKKGHMKFRDDGTGYFNKKDCDKDVYALFGNAVYPVCLDSELMMKDKAEAWGMMDIMDKSWFCYQPINGKPCGMCGPCKVKMKQHMDFLFDPFLLSCGLVDNYLFESCMKTRNGTWMFALFERYVREFRSKAVFNTSNDFAKRVFLNHYQKEIALFEYMIKNPPIKHRFFRNGRAKPVSFIGKIFNVKDLYNLSKA